MQKNRLNSSAENSGKKKAAEQILISTHNAVIKDNLRGGSTSYVQKRENMYRRKDGRWEGLFIKEYHADGKAEYGYGKHIRKSSKCYRVSKRYAYTSLVL